MSGVNTWTREERCVVQCTALPSPDNPDPPGCQRLCIGCVQPYPIPFLERQIAALRRFQIFFCPDSTDRNPNLQPERFFVGSSSPSSSSWAQVVREVRRWVHNSQQPGREYEVRVFGFANRNRRMSLYNNYYAAMARAVQIVEDLKTALAGRYPAALVDRVIRPCVDLYSQCSPISCENPQSDRSRFAWIECIPPRTRPVQSGVPFERWAVQYEDIQTMMFMGLAAGDIRVEKVTIKLTKRTQSPPFEVRRYRYVGVGVGVDILGSIQHVFRAIRGTVGRVGQQISASIFRWPTMPTDWSCMEFHPNRGISWSDWEHAGGKTGHILTFHGTGPLTGRWTHFDFQSANVLPPASFVASQGICSTIGSRGISTIVRIGNAPAVQALRHVSPVADTLAVLASWLTSPTQHRDWADLQRATTPLQSFPQNCVMASHGNMHGLFPADSPMCRRQVP